MEYGTDGGSRVVVGARGRGRRAGVETPGVQERRSTTCMWGRREVVLMDVHTEYVRDMDGASATA